MKMLSIKESRFCELAELTAFEHRAIPGEVFAYYKGGSLGRDIEFNGGTKTPTAAMASVVNRIRDLFNLGRIDLTQKRLAHGKDSAFSYQAVFRHTPVKVPNEHKLPHVKAFDEAKVA